MRLLPTGEPIRKRNESGKHLRRQDRDRLQSRRHVNIVDFTGVSYARDVYELWRPEDALLTKSVAARLYSLNRQKVYGVNDKRFLAANSLTKRALNFRILLRYLRVYDVYDVYESRAQAAAKQRGCKRHVYRNRHSQRFLLTGAALVKRFVYGSSLAGAPCRRPSMR